MSALSTQNEALAAGVSVVVQRYAERLRSGELPDQPLRNAAVLACIALHQSTGGKSRGWYTVLRSELMAYGVADMPELQPRQVDGLARIACASVQPAGWYEPEQLIDHLVSATAEERGKFAS